VVTSALLLEGPSENSLGCAVSPFPFRHQALKLSCLMWPCRPDNNPRGAPISRCDNMFQKTSLSGQDTRVSRIIPTSPLPRRIMHGSICKVLSSSSPSPMLCPPIHVPCFHVLLGSFFQSSICIKKHEGIQIFCLPRSPTAMQSGIEFTAVYTRTPSSSS
jgi:hypothetical protein